MSADRPATPQAAPTLRATWLDDPAASRLHARAEAARWGLSVDRFHETLARVAAKRFTGGTPTPREVEAWLETLHLEDLALARACADGADVAWEAFVDRHWREVTRAARAIAGDAEGEEIADALLADLFARGDGHATRRPLFDYFHGRSKLGTWLRALVAQRHVDRLRATRRLTAFDEQEADTRPAPGPAPDEATARVSEPVERALDRALEALPPRDRLRLAYYHADELTLAAIGRLLGEHEATVSRKLQKTRDQLKAAIDAVLTTELRLGPDERRACYEQVIAIGRFDVARLRTVAPSGAIPAVAGKNPDPGRSKDSDGTS